MSSVRRRRNASVHLKMAESSVDWLRLMVVQLRHHNVISSMNLRSNAETCDQRTTRMLQSTVVYFEKKKRSSRMCNRARVSSLERLSASSALSLLTWIDSNLRIKAFPRHSQNLQKLSLKLKSTKSPWRRLCEKFRRDVEVLKRRTSSCNNPQLCRWQRRYREMIRNICKRESLN